MSRRRSLATLGMTVCVRRPLDEVLRHSLAQGHRFADAGRAAGSGAGSAPGAGARARDVAQLPRPDHRRRQLRARRPQARSDPAVGWRGRSRRDRSWRDAGQGRRSCRRVLHAEMGGRGDRRRSLRLGDGRRHRRHADRACRAGRGWRGEAAGRPELRRRRHPALRRRHRVARAGRDRRHQGGRHGAGVGLGRRVDLRFAVRQDVRRSGARDVELEGQGRAAEDDGRGGSGRLSRHARLGPGDHEADAVAAASTSPSRSAAPAPCRVPSWRRASPDASR